MAATHTTNLNLNKPARTDFVSVVSDINDNMDTLDGAIGAVPQGKTVQGQIDAKADKDNTVLTSSLSMGRKANTTVGTNSSAIGNNVEASGNYSHCEGDGSKSLKNYSHAEGKGTTADGQAAHAEGWETLADGRSSHAEGRSTVAGGQASHAEGYHTEAVGDFSHVVGSCNVSDSERMWAANTHYYPGDRVTVVSDTTYMTCKTEHTSSNNFNNDTEYWEATTGSGSLYAEIVGNGANTSNPSNARALEWNGNEHIAGDIYVNCNDDSTGGTALGAEVTGVKSTIGYVPSGSTVMGKIAEVNSTIGTVPTGHTVMGDISDVKSAIQQISDPVWGTKAAGIARKVISDQYATDKLPYNFRKAFDADWNEDKLIGGTVAWNQLTTPYPTHTIGDVTITQNNDGSVTLSGTSSQSGSLTTHQNISVFANHVYIIVPSNDTLSTYTAIGGSTGFYGSKIRKATESNSNVATSFRTDANVEYNNVKAWLCIFDLTQMFGSTIADAIYTMEQTTAGAGVAWFRSLFPNDYYAYDAGSLQSVQAESHVMRGFNAWDEQWENTYYNNEGVKTTNNNLIGSKNFIPVIGGAIYYGYIGGVGTLTIAYFDRSKNFIRRQTGLRKETFTIPNECGFIAISTSIDYGGTYKHDICINLSDPAKNGTYEPYKSDTYPLGNVELRGIPKLTDNNLYYDGDEYQHDGTVTRRYGIVDLGTKSWSRGNYDGIDYFLTTLNDAKAPATPNKMNNLLCEKYVQVKTSGVTTDFTDKSFFIFTNKSLYFRDDSYTTASAFKSDMSGVYLVYELETPTTETTDPFEFPQDVFYDGTEEYVDRAVTAETPTRDVAIPVGHESKYYKDFRREVREMIANVQALILENT